MIKLPTFDETLKDAITSFRNHFGDEPNIGSFAPGRVNLIGEHVDYNNGFVLPVALPYKTLIVGKHRPGSVAQIVTLCDGVGGDRKVKFDTKTISPGGVPKWLNYVKGVMVNFTKGKSIEYGFDAVINTNVPIGGGLSSSAALEVATLKFMEALLRDGERLSDSERALICQKAEHDYAGMPCGIMDQLISVMANRDYALLIDCE